MTSTADINWQRTAITFSGLADLQGFAYDNPVKPGTSVHLHVLWAVKSELRDSLSQFIHLIGPQTTAVLADGIPRAGRYPTWAWTAGERIVDEWQLAIPASLPSGEYVIKIGFYRQDTGERLPVLQNGEVNEERTATLLSFRVG